MEWQLDTQSFGCGNTPSYRQGTLYLLQRDEFLNYTALSYLGQFKYWWKRINYNIQTLTARTSSLG